MSARLSGTLPRLATAGNRIVTAGDQVPVRLRGVNRSGLEYSAPDEQGFLSAAGITSGEIFTIVKTWGASVIRLPFNQDWALHGRNGRNGEEYLRALDQVIAWAAGLGAYTILDLQWLDADTRRGGEDNFVPPLPNLQSIDLWRLLAERYGPEPGVLFDIFNEPHDRLPDDPLPLLHPDGSEYPADARLVTAAGWNAWAGTITAAIRSIAPDILVLVSGIDWGYDLRGVSVDSANVVYSTHVYPGKRLSWPEAFGGAVENRPVFAAEWGGMNADVRWGRRLAAYFDKLGIGWTAWSWNNDPLLMKRYVPTRFGEIVRDRLQVDGTRHSTGFIDAFFRR